MVRYDLLQPLAAARATRRACRILAILTVASAAGPLGAQTLGCKLSTRSGTPPIDVVTCDGLTIESERTADVRVLDRASGGVPDAARVEGGAVLVTVRPGRPVPFQILTPKAIASVRGTRYAVDARPDRTSVFVATGTVAVARPDGGAELLLGPGEGVDVGDSSGPLTRTRWPRKRVAALLKRLRH